MEEAEAGPRLSLADAADSFLVSLGRRGFKVAAATGVLGLAAFNSGQIDVKEFGGFLVGVSSAIATAAAVSKSSVDRVLVPGRQVRVRPGIALKPLLRGIGIVNIIGACAYFSRAGILHSLSRCVRFSSCVVGAAGLVIATDTQRELAGADPAERSPILIPREAEYPGLLSAIVPAKYEYEIRSVEDLLQMSDQWLAAADAGLEIHVDVIPHIDPLIAMGILEAVEGTQNRKLIQLAQDCPMLARIASWYEAAMLVRQEDSEIELPKGNYFYRIKSVEDFVGMSNDWIAASRLRGHVDVDIVPWMAPETASSVMTAIEATGNSVLIVLAVNCPNLRQKAFHHEFIHDHDGEELIL